KTESRYFLVAVLLTPQSRPVVQHIRRARRALGVQSPGGEFKARYAQPKVITRFLSALAQEDISLYVVVADKYAPRVEEVLK
ncbi:MAG: hypothetical protein NZM11_13365, partial [Anaerolineales bacterium]|nr:hypothetical protein [Anaerolineales bacterium]